MRKFDKQLSLILFGLLTAFIAVPQEKIPEESFCHNYQFSTSEGELKTLKVCGRIDPNYVRSKVPEGWNLIGVSKASEFIEWENEQKRIERQRIARIEQVRLQEIRDTNFRDFENSTSGQFLNALIENNQSACKFSSVLADRLLGFSDVCIHVDMKSVDDGLLKFSHDRIYHNSFRISSVPGEDHIFEVVTGRLSDTIVFRNSPSVTINDGSAQIVFAEGYQDGIEVYSIAIDVNKSNPEYHPLMDLFD